MNDWRSAPVLEGPTLTLAPLALDDAADLLAALGEPTAAAEVLEHMRLVVPTDLDGARAQIVDAMDNPERIAYGIRTRATGEFVGSTSFYEISPETRAVAIGYTWIGRRHWRTRVNTESKLVMLTRAFDGLGAERVVWHTDIRNVRSQAAIERLGAVREGVLRHHRIRLDGSWRDTVQYSMLAQEWPTVRERLLTALNRDLPHREDR